MRSLRICYLGNFDQVPYSTENHIAESLQECGHMVTKLQEGEVPTVRVPFHAEGHDLFMWTQTYGLAEKGGTNDERHAMLGQIRSMGVPSVGVHLDKWWHLSRSNQLEDQAFFRQDYVFTADGGNQKRFAALGINHFWMPPGIVDSECYLGTPSPEYSCDVAFVGSWRGYHPEWKHRRELFRFLYNTYGERFGYWPRQRTIRGNDLNRLYASVKVVVGDSCMVGNTGFYFSDRVPETIGRGGFLVHPYTSGLDECFTPGKHIACWSLGNWGELKETIDYYLENERERNQIRLAGHEHVRQHHTYAVRMREVLSAVKRHRGSL